MRTRLTEQDTIIGNANIYGLGIRLSMYLQLAAMAIAGFWLLSERDGLLWSHFAFQIAVVIAVLGFIFGHACIFTAVIVALL